MEGKVVAAAAWRQKAVGGVVADKIHHRQRVEEHHMDRRAEDRVDTKKKKKNTDTDMDMDTKKRIHLHIRFRD